LKFSKETGKPAAFTRIKQDLVVIITFYEILLITKIAYRKKYLLRKKYGLRYLRNIPPRVRSAKHGHRFIINVPLDTL